MWFDMPVSGAALSSFLKPGIIELCCWSTTSNTCLLLTLPLKLFARITNCIKGFLCSRRVLCGNRVKVSSITSSGESIKLDLHKEGPGLDTRWALFSGHLIRGVGHSNSTLMPSGWLCPALLSFLSIHNGEPPSSNPNLLTPMTPSPHHTIDPVQPFCPQPHFIMQWGRSEADQNTYCTARSCLHNKVQGVIDIIQPHPSPDLSLTLH